jgi:hypothetical protein
MVRIRVWMRDHAERFDTAAELAEEVTWLYNAYVGPESDQIPPWILEEANQLMKEIA